MAQNVGTLLVARQAEPVEIFRAHHAGDPLELEGPVEDLLEGREIARPVELLIELDPKRPVVSVEPDAVREAALFEERVKVDLARYRVEAVVGDDEERSAGLDSGVPDRLAQHPDAGVGVGQSGGSQVVVRTVAMLRVVGREKMDGQQVRAMGPDGMGGGPRQNRVGGTLEARRPVPLVVNVDRNTCLSQRCQEARLGPCRVGVVARVECLREIIVDGRVPPGLGPEEGASKLRSPKLRSRSAVAREIPNSPYV
jgi:hypothetical protein